MGGRKSDQRTKDKRWIGERRVISSMLFNLIGVHDWLTASHEGGETRRELKKSFVKSHSWCMKELGILKKGFRGQEDI